MENHATDSTGDCPVVELGRGRSGRVLRMTIDQWKELGDQNNLRPVFIDQESARPLASDFSPFTDLAVKIFHGEALARVVHYILSGAPNPYTWNGDAVRCAALRRRILTGLVEVWFGDCLTVADVADTRWNETELAFEMAARFIEGRPTTLRHPFSAAREDEYRELVGQVMRPLARHLEEAGFDGLVWQAGKSNPVATNNFLLDDGSGRRRWWWIDLESGVPALVPINPWVLLTYYLPKSWQHGRPLFDDVDTGRLRTYLNDQALTIQRRVGTERFAAMQADVELLDRHQRAWKRLTRLQRSIGYARSQQRVSESEADWYAEHAWRWYTREAVRAGSSAVRRGWQRLTSFARWLTGVDVVGRLADMVRALVSQSFRLELARAYLRRRLDVWHRRRHLTAAEAECLRAELEESEASAYLTDFGMHLAIKPPVKLLAYGVVLPLAAAGVISPGLAAILAVGSGSIGRTLYTLGRLVQAALHRQGKPWVALLVGTLPVVGNLAFPAQVIGASAGGQNRLAQFIVLDSFTRLGTLFPVWGGADTGVEHLWNRLGGIVAGKRAVLDGEREVTERAA